MARRVAGKRRYPLGKVYGLLEPGPVVLVTTARDGKPDAMPMSWLTMMEFEPPLVGCVMSNRNFSFDSLVAECYANLECRIHDDRMVEEYGFFVLEVVAAWIDSAREAPRQIHHRGNGVFAVDAPRLVRLSSRAK